MRGFDRNAMGWDLRFAEFLAWAPVCCVAAFAAVTGIDTAGRLGIGQGMDAAIVFFIGGLWVMAAHYLLATIPSFLTWGLIVRLARSCGLGADAAMRLAAPATAMVASVLLLAWLRDEDYRGMVPTIALVSVPISFLVADRIIRSGTARKTP